MNEKFFLLLILSLLLILPLAACGAPTTDPVATDAPTPEQITEPVHSDTPSADEYERAAWYGFVSDERSEADLKSAVTWAQYIKRSVFSTN